MINKKEVVFVVIFLALAVLSMECVDATPLSSDSQDLSEWRMAGRDLGRTRYYPGPIPNDISQLEVRSYSTGNSAGGMAIADGFAYGTSTWGAVYRLNATNISQKIDQTGTLSSPSTAVPAIAGEYLYVSGYGTFWQINATNLTQYIATHTGHTALVYASPIVHNGYAYFSDWYSRDRIYQLNASNISKEIATYSRSGCDSTPAIWNDSLYFLCSNTVYRLNSSNIAQSLGSYTAGSSAREGSGIVAAQGSVYFGTADDKLYQINASTMTLMATYTTGGDIEWGEPAYGNGFVYVNSEDGFTYQLNATNVSQHIANFSTGFTDGSMAVNDDYLLVGGTKIFQLNAKDISQEIANYSLGNSEDISIVNGIIYISAGYVFYQFGSDMPISTLSSPDDSYEMGVSAQNITFNCSGFDNSGLTNISLYITNNEDSDFLLNQTTVISSQSNSSSWTLELTEGNYTWNCLIYDDEGNSDWATNRTIGPDITSPTVTISAPASDTHTTDTGLNISYTATDTYLDSCWYSNDSMTINITLDSCANITSVTWSEGQHNVTVWANDTKNNVGSAEVNFTIDITDPLFTDISNQTVEYADALAYDINASDNIGVSCFSVNDTTNFKINCSGYLENNSLLKIGMYNLNITINDSAGNLNYSLMWVNVSDTTAPEFSGISNQSIYDLDGLGYDVDATDAHNVSCYSVNDTTNFKINCSGYLENNTQLAVGTYNLNITINDSSGNHDSVEMWVNVSLKPIIGMQLIYPTENTNTTQNEFFYVTVNVSCTRTDCGKINVSLDPATNLVLNGDFETGDLTSWTTGGNADWFTQTTTVAEGTYAAQGGDVGNSQSTWISQNVTLTEDANLSFSWRVSSESGYDYLLYCPDAPTCTRTSGYTARIAGSTSWATKTYSLTAGTHTLHWLYAKDGSVSSGSDTGWLDNITIFSGGSKNGLVSNSMGTTPFYTNVTNPYNITLSDGGSALITWWVNATGDINQAHEFFVYANKSTHMSISNSTIKWNMTIVEEQGPVISVVTPAAGSFTDSLDLDILYTVLDSDLDSCWYAYEDSNTSLTDCENVTEVNWSEGQHTVVIYANDSEGNVGSASLSFTVDTIYPEINILSPINNSNTTDNGLDVEYLATDTNLDSCWYSNDSMDVNVTSAGCANLTTIIWSEGQHNVTVGVNDSAGHINTTSVIFTVDSTSPSFVNLTNQTLNLGEDLEYQINSTDVSGVSCYTVNDTGFTINCSGYLENDVSLEFGTYNLNITVNDTLGNVGSAVILVTVDTSLIINCEAGGPYQQGALVLVQGNVTDGNVSLSALNVSINVDGNSDASENQTTADDGSFQTEFSGLNVGSYVLNVSASYQGVNRTCTDSFSVGSPASLVLDKIVTIHNMTNTTINYNVTLKVTNMGGSDATSANLTDLDSNMSSYDLGTVSVNSSVSRIYLKEFTRNSTTYNLTLLIASVNSIDLYTGDNISANSGEIVLIIPASPTGQQLTLVKNAYYNSENTTAVNYSLSVDVVNSGGVDLTSITLLDSDMGLNTIVDLNRTQNYSYFTSVIVDKAASNTNKLFVQATATVNSITYSSNQIRVRIPGYGGPADTIVDAPESVGTSTSFDSTITVLNMNEDIGQDFTVDYWISNDAETTNHTSGQQTIYVAASGQTDLTATLTSPSSAGTYRVKAVTSWTEGTATAYDSFTVTAATTTGSGSTGSGGGSSKKIEPAIDPENEDEEPAAEELQQEEIQKPDLKGEIEELIDAVEDKADNLDGKIKVLDLEDESYELADIRDKVSKARRWAEQGNIQEANTLLSIIINQLSLLESGIIAEETYNKTYSDMLTGYAVQQEIDEVSTGPFLAVIMLILTMMLVAGAVFVRYNYLMQHKDTAFDSRKAIAVDVQALQDHGYNVVRIIEYKDGNTKEVYYPADLTEYLNA